MEDQVKNYLATVRKEMEELKGMEELKEVENSLMLVKFFYDLKNLLKHNRIKEFVISNISKPHSSPEQLVDLCFISYNTALDGRFNEKLIRHLQMSNGELREPEYLEEYKKVLSMVKQNNKTLKPITVELTLEEFMEQFGHSHLAKFLKYSLDKSLPLNGDVKRPKSKI